MTPQQRKIVIPVILGGVALSIALLYVFRAERPSALDRARENARQTQEERSQDDTGAAAADDSPAEAELPPPGNQEDTEVDTAGDAAAASPGTVSLKGLHAIAPDGVPATLATLGSFDWRQHDLFVEFSRFGAGVDRITLTDIYNTSKSRRIVDDVKTRFEAGDLTIDQALAELPANDRYIIQRTRPFGTETSNFLAPAFVARSIWIEGGANTETPTTPWVNVFDEVWSHNPAEPGVFTTEIRNENDEPVARITRKFTLSDHSFGLSVEQTFENLTDAPLAFRWLQYGQADLDVDRARYMDRRRMRIGHLGDPARGADQTIVQADTAFFWERSGSGVPCALLGGGTALTSVAASNTDPALQNKVEVWPTEESTEKNYTISWFASENRYFTAAMYPSGTAEGAPALSLADIAAVIVPYYDGEVTDDPVVSGHDNILFEITSPLHTIPAAGEGVSSTINLDYATYTGPLNPEILAEEQPYVALNMDYLILYQMSSCCAICTFQWLAHGLLWFLSLVHAVTFDWGVAIIILVLVVRAILHPITKRSQIAMQRFQKAMQKLSPELEKLKAKYKDEPKRLQQEQLRLWREHNVSPASMLGCLPMFLQMPIWVALYAMLYFAWELRQEPAFWGLFQVFWDWQFLADLSAGDHFFWEFAEPTHFLFWNITGINLLPFLMAGIFFIQQKYMTPQTTANMTKEQQQTQRMMRVMMVVLFPLMLYSAPSGLTLYILTSSILGIIESRHIRKHVESLDLESTIVRKPKEPKRKPKDPQARAYLDAVERAKAKREQKGVKRFKKRK